MADYLKIEIDSKETIALLDKLQNNMSDQQFKNAMYGVFNRTGKHVGRILRQDLPIEYHVKKKDITSALGRPKVSTSTFGVGCTIPLRAARGTIGGNSFRAAGGARGWNSLKRKYRVRAYIVKDHVSTLPGTMDTGLRPFRNLSAPKLNGVAYVRTSKNRLPIKVIKGIAIPQMPVNRSENAVQNDIGEYFGRQVEQRVKAMIYNGL